MSWEDEQDRVTREGRLFLAPPEMVFAELKRLGRRNRAEIMAAQTEALEATLIERNDQLINLGLACYCTNKAVFSALYRHSMEPARDTNNAIYKRNLRLGCLSNRTITSAHSMFDFPRDLIGEQEVFRTLGEAELPEVDAMLSNPTVSDRLLEEIFLLTGPMTEMTDERRAVIVGCAAKNERIDTEREYLDSPGMGHDTIHKAIFHFLEIAPIEPRWFWVVSDVLGRLVPGQVYRPERIDHVLDRWKRLKLSGYRQGQEMEGSFTGLSMTEELRCQIAALYGRGYAKEKPVYFGSADADDVALRCAYYGCADIGEKEMKAGYERDKDVYVFAATFNPNIIADRKRRKLFEEEHLAGHLAKLYLKHFAALKKRRPDIGEPLSDELKEEARPEDPTDARLERIESATAALQTKLAEWAKQFQSFKGFAIAIAIGLAIAYWFRK